MVHIRKFFARLMYFFLVSWGPATTHYWNWPNESVDFSIRFSTWNREKKINLPIYLFENSAHTFSLIAMAFSPLSWVGVMPFASTNGGEKGVPIGLRIEWGKNGRGHKAIFHLAAFVFKHKVEENAPQLLREKWEPRRKAVGMIIIQIFR